MNLIVIFTAVLLLVAGGADIYKQKRKTCVLDEIVRFVLYARSELHYRTPDLENLFISASKQNYSYLSFSDYTVKPDDMCDELVKKDFSEFVSRLGTTDTDGQLSLCDEYASRFTEKLTERKQREKSKIQISAALSILSAMCVLVLFM
ncbi:MAG: hypothetical protein J6D06_07385 [Clostridia bacterium]|nr:hypothetical protein [Clostridia bacterium]